MIFNFNNDSGILNYLNNLKFELPNRYELF